MPTGEKYKTAIRYKLVFFFSGWGGVGGRGGVGVGGGRVVGLLNFETLAPSYLEA